MIPRNILLFLIFGTLFKNISSFAFTDSEKIGTKSQKNDDSSLMWTNITQFLTIDEEMVQAINVEAELSDPENDSKVNYKVKDLNGGNRVNVDADTGEITIKAIDRDQGISEYMFQVTAFIVENPESSITANITLFINDIDDNIPEISSDYASHQAQLLIDEDAVDLGLKKIWVSDIDSDENCVYNISLVSTSDEVDYTSAFSVTPSRGFGNTTVYITVTDPRKLDYEDKAWRTFTIELQTVGFLTPDNNNTFPISITIEDINDEVPKFEKNVYVVKLSESTRGGTIFSELIQATDKDDEDIKKGLKHEILGPYAKAIQIDESGGFVTVIEDNVFDYEQKHLILIQVRATDAAEHSSTATIIIIVENSNDEPPKIILDPPTFAIDENKIEIPVEISATDLDIDADLEFVIDWNNTYATKNSINIPEEHLDVIKSCIEFETTPEGNQKLTAILSIKDSADGRLDYEIFDSLLLQLVVTDKNTVENDASARANFTITLNDVNDNLPIFPEDTKTEGNVSDGDGENTEIMTITATDADTVDIISYSIQPADDKIPEWVQIDTETGVISVKEGIVIDCDVPICYLKETDECDDLKPFELSYNVIASDGQHDANITIKINIVDVNDNVPKLDNASKIIPEDYNNGEVVLKLNITDDDRDEAYKTVACTIKESEAKKRFTINDGHEIVVDLKDGATLDREEIEKYEVELDCYDNPQEHGTDKSNQISPAPIITIILEDVNDEVPTINNTKIEDKRIDEQTNGVLPVTLYGIDFDEGNNGFINFVEIIKITRIVDGEEVKNPSTDGLLTVSNKSKDNNKNGILKTTKPLKGFYGDLILTIHLEDLGEDPQKNNVNITLHVFKSNFKPPVFVNSDLCNSIIALSKNYKLNVTLILDDCTTPLVDIIATDQQDDKFDLNLSLGNTSEGKDIFSITDEGKSTGQLQLTSDPVLNHKYFVDVVASVDVTEVGDPNKNAPLTETCRFYLEFSQDCKE